MLGPKLFATAARKWKLKADKYCWWKKFCTAWDLWNTANRGINWTGAGFLPSTVFYQLSPISQRLNLLLLQAISKYPVKPSAHRHPHSGMLLHWSVDLAFSSTLFYLGDVTLYIVFHQQPRWTTIRIYLSFRKTLWHGFCHLPCGKLRVQWKNTMPSLDAL